MGDRMKPLTEAFKDSLDSLATTTRRVAEVPDKHRTKLDNDLNRRNETDQELAGGASSGPPHGSLTSQPDGTQLSGAGLTYGPDPSPNFATRVDHVRAHEVDAPNRPSHGVFNGDGVALTDEAWARVQSGGSVQLQQGQRTIHFVDMQREVGYIGGQRGAAAGNPSVSYIQMVLEGTNVITSFPVSGIPMGG